MSNRTMSDESLKLRSRLAHAAKNDPDAVEAARRDFEAARLADHIRRVVDEAPPLTAEQKSRLTALLHNGAE